jgi:hypothetical protein
MAGNLCKTLCNLRLIIMTMLGNFLAETILIEVKGSTDVISAWIQITEYACVDGVTLPDLYNLNEARPIVRPPVEDSMKYVP